MHLSMPMFADELEQILHTAWAEQMTETQSWCADWLSSVSGWKFMG